MPKKSSHTPRTSAAAPLATRASSWAVASAMLRAYEAPEPPMPPVLRPGNVARVESVRCCKRCRSLRVDGRKDCVVGAPAAAGLP
jgi:hypothetical protein